VPVEVRPVDLTKRRKVIYLIGEEVPAGLPECDFLIYQNALPSRAARRPDLVLPASLFAESAGTLINGGGRMLEIKKAIESPGEARPDWWVFVGLGGSLGHRKGKYKDIAGIHAEIKKQVKGFPFAKKRVEFPGISYSERAKAKRPSHGAASAAYPFLLFWKPDQDSYRGVALAEVVEGMKLIGNRGRLVVSHEDALRLGVTRGETVNVSSNGYDAEFPVAISTIAVPGTVHLLSAATVQFGANPCPVQIRRNHE
jgi:formate dehydrogenase major subunit